MFCCDVRTDDPVYTLKAHDDAIPGKVSLTSCITRVVLCANCKNYRTRKSVVVALPHISSCKTCDLSMFGWGPFLLFCVDFNSLSAKALQLSSFPLSHKIKWVSWIRRWHAASPFSALTVFTILPWAGYRHTPLSCAPLLLWETYKPRTKFCSLFWTSNFATKI